MVASPFCIPVASTFLGYFCEEGLSSRGRLRTRVLIKWSIFAPLTNFNKAARKDLNEEQFNFSHWNAQNWLYSSSAGILSARGGEFHIPTAPTSGCRLSGLNKQSFSLGLFVLCKRLQHIYTSARVGILEIRNFCKARGMQARTCFRNSTNQQKKHSIIRRISR